MQNPNGVPLRLILAALVLPVLPVVHAVGNSQPSAVPVVFQVETTGESGEKALEGVVVTATRVQAEDTHQVPVSENFATLLLPRGSTWIVKAEADGYWSPETVFTAGASAEPVGLELFPAGRVLVPLELGQGESAPSALSLAFEPAAGSTDVTIPRVVGEVQCTVSEEKIAQCRNVPAGVHDLRLSSTGWIPRYWWDIQVRAGQTHALDSVSLMRGASVYGSIVYDGRGETPSGIQVTLEPAFLGGVGDPASRRRIERGRIQTLVDDRDTFQLGPVPPGTYLLRVEHPDLAAVTRGPIEVRPELEAQLLEAIRLGPPLEIQIFVEPPNDPWGLPWEVVLVPSEEGLGANPIEATADPDVLGLFRVQGLSPGDYTAEIRPRSEEGRPLSEVWVGREIELVQGELDPIVVDVPLYEVEGRATKGGERITGRLLWIAIDEPTSRGRIFFDLDDSGEFSGFLTEPGRWAPRWYSEGADKAIGLEPIEIADERRQEISIEIPDTAIVGEVVDASGEVVPGAYLTILRIDRKEPPGEHRADEAGEFTIEGLRPGSYMIEAYLGERRSEMVPVQLQESLDSPELRLILRGETRIAGRVTSRGAPVAGARVLGWPDFGSTPGAGVSTAVTDVAGRFSLTFSSDSLGCTLVVQAPGYGSRILRVLADPSQPLELELEPVSGTLVLDWGPQDMGSGQPVPLLARDGALVPAPFLMNLLQGDARIESDELVIPGMAIGEYALCAGEGSFVAMGAGGSPPAAECTGGHLGPQGRLRLEPSPR